MEVFILNTLKISLAPTLQEGPFQVVLAGAHHTKEQKELNTRERKGATLTSCPTVLSVLCFFSGHIVVSSFVCALSDSRLTCVPQPKVKGSIIP